MTLRSHTTARLLLPAGMLLLLLVAYRTGDAQAPPQPAAGAPCPGQTVQGVLATGVYTPKPVDDIKIGGQPAPGAIWSPGMRSYWHCHAGGQIMMLDQGVGRVQERGQKMRILHRGETEYAAPGVEHWHGAAGDSSAQFFQVSIGDTRVFWMEEVGNADYNGNDIGINSRTDYLRTGQQKKADVTAPPGTPSTPPAAPAAPANRGTPGH
jgi:hypothetical protein